MLWVPSVSCNIHKKRLDFVKKAILSVICDGKSRSRVKDRGSRNVDFEYGTFVYLFFFENWKGTFAMPKRNNSDVVSGSPSRTPSTGVTKTQASKTQTSDPENTDTLGASKTQTTERLRPSRCIENLHPVMLLNCHDFMTFCSTE